MGAISDGEALAGSIGGVVGEVVGEAYADTHPEGFNPDAEDYDPELHKSLKKKGEILTQVSAALAAAFLGENPNVAACTALNAVHENAFAFPDVIGHKNDEINICEMELSNLENALDRAISSQERQALEIMVSQKKEQLLEARAYLSNLTGNKRAFQQAGDEAVGKIIATGTIENETLLGWIDPVNRFFDDIQERASRLPLMFVPELSNAPKGWDVLNYSQQTHFYQEMRIGQDFLGCATDMARIPTN